MNHWQSPDLFTNLAGSLGMHKDIERILITEEEWSRKYKKWESRFPRTMWGKTCSWSHLKRGGSFLSDLMRKISIPLHLDFMAVSSYGQATESSGAVMILERFGDEYLGKACPHCGGYRDTGLTLKYIVENLKTRNPLSLKVCTLLDKPVLAPG